MLLESHVLALLQASITGAGLVLAVYALIVPLSRKFFGYRAEAIHEELKDLKERIRETDTRVSSKQLKELKAIVESIEERRIFPTYLSWGAGLSFFGYTVSVLMCFFWIIDLNKLTVDYYIPFTFFISTVFFLLVGIYSVKDISQTMKREFEYLKKKVDEAKSEADISVENL